MVAVTAQRLGRLDIVVSNAGVIRWERFPDLTPENVRAILRVNILGNVNVCRAAAKQMIVQGGGGRIIIVSSVQSDVQFPVTPVYGASKHAMHALVGSLALELAPHRVTVNHIGPGWVRSPLNDAAPDQRTPCGHRGATRRRAPAPRRATRRDGGRGELPRLTPRRLHHGRVHPGGRRVGHQQI